MKFRFEALLRIRKNEENRQQRDLGLINSHVIQQEDRLTFMETVLKDTKKDMDQKSNELTDISRHLLYDKFFTGMDSKKNLQQKVLQEAITFREARRQNLSEAVRKRRTLEILKEKHTEAWKESMQKRETQIMDEIALNTWRMKWNNENSY